MLRLIQVSSEEAAILDDIEDVAFGEIYNLRSEQKGPFKPFLLSPEAANFITELRAHPIDKVVIHQSEPTLIEYTDTTPNGHRCLRRKKLNL